MKIGLLSCLFFPVLLIGCTINKSSNADQISIPYIKGESRTIIAAAPDSAKVTKWFTNDHCFVKDHNNVIHWFGINNPYPPAGKDLYRYHPYLGHCTSKSMESGWKREDFVLNEIEGTEYLGAPYVIWHEESKRWVMVIETWRKDRRLEVYWSDDLYNWKTSGKFILPETLWIGTRDPHIMKGTDGKYWIHVVSTGNKDVHQSQVLRIKTSDFENFDDPETIMGIDDCTWATLIESPFVYEHNGTWYLFFTYAHRRYTETVVVASKDPNHFDYKNNVIATLFGHAAEIFEYNGKTYISSCGPEDACYANTHGVTLAELKWTPSNK